MKRFVGYLFILVLSLFLTVSLYSCGGGGSSSTNSSSSSVTSGYTITGTIVTQNTGGLLKGIDNLFSANAFALITTGFPNQIVAVSKDGTILKSFPIDSGGNFTIDTKSLNSSGAIFFVINKDNDYVYGNLKLQTGQPGVYLDYIPVGDMTEGIDMGYIPLDNLTGPSIESCGAFKESQIDNLNSLARIDDAYTIYRNNLENKDIKCQIKAMYTYCTWTFADFTKFDNYTKLISKEACNYADIQPILQYKPPFQLKDNSSEVFTLYPPDNTSVGCWSNSNNAWCNADNGSIYMGGIYVGKNGMSSKSYYSSKTDLFLINLPGVYGNMPQGEWLLKNSEDEIIGSFNFYGIGKFNQCSYNMYFIPYIKLNHDNNNYLTSMYVKWYIFDGEKEKPVNKDYFYSFVSNLKVYYDFAYDNVNLPNYGPYNMNLQSIIDNGTTFVFVPDSNHKFPLSTSPCWKDIDIYYNIGSIEYRMGLDTCGGAI